MSVSSRGGGQHCCSEMAGHLEAGEVALIYDECFREYGIRILDGGSSIQLIQFCPWCGGRLPASLRDRWFERLDELGLQPADPNLPHDLKSDGWWRSEDENGSERFV